MDQNNPLWRVVYPLIASIAGAIASLANQPLKDMSAFQIFLALVSGTGFGFFVFPLIFHGLENNPSAAGGICFLLATSWNVTLPVLIKKFLPGGPSK